MVWDDLLLQLAQSYDSFVDVFLEKAVANIAAFKTTDNTQDATDPEKSAVYLWILHILYSDEWAKVRSDQGAEWANTAARECTLYPSDQWCQDLADEVGKKMDEVLDEGWKDLIVADVSTPESVKDCAAPGTGGWRKASRAWKPVPIGVVQN